MKKSILYSIIIIIIMLSSIQISAFCIDNYLYEVIRIIVSSLLILSFVFSIEMKSIKHILGIPLLNTHFLIVICVGLFLFFCLSFNEDLSLFSIRDLAIVLIIILISYNMQLSEKQLVFLMYVFVIFNTFSGLTIFLKYANGFVIDESYFPVPKNQISPSYAIAIILSFYLFFFNKSSKRWVLLIMLINLIIFSIAIRGRSAMIATVLAFILFVFFYLKSKKSKVFIVISTIFGLSLISSFIYDSFFINQDVTDLNDLSSGRVELIDSGLNFFFDNPLLGQLLSKKLYLDLNIHNYLLDIIVNYGLILGVFFILNYFNYLKFIYKGIVNNEYLLIDIVPLLILLLFVISLTEYTFPFAPGSTVFFPFFLLGQYFKLKKRK